MSKKIGYAVVGLGIGMAHVDAALSSDKANLIAVCDLIQAKLDKVTSKNAGVIGYLDFDEMIKNPDIDIVSICLPSAMHADYAIKAMEAGKHVLIEKPVDITPERAIKIEEARVRLGGKVKAGVVHQNRNNACMKPMKDIIDSGRLGKIFLGTFAVKWYRDQRYYDGWHGTWDMDGGGSLINQSVHTVDLMQWLLGDVESVTSEYGIFGHDIETEDMTASLIKFKSGATATFVSTTCAYPGISTDIQVYGTGGSIEADADVLKTWKLRTPSDDYDDEEDEEAAMLEIYGKGNRSAVQSDPTLVSGHNSVVYDMIDAVINDRDPQIMPLEAIKSVKIVNAVYESAKTGKTIKL